MAGQFNNERLTPRDLTYDSWHCPDYTASLLQQSYCLSPRIRSPAFSPAREQPGQRAGRQDRDLPAPEALLSHHVVSVHMQSMTTSRRFGYPHGGQGRKEAWALGVIPTLPHRGGIHSSGPEQGAHLGPLVPPVLSKGEGRSIGHRRHPLSIKAPGKGQHHHLSRQHPTGPSSPPYALAPLIIQTETPRNNSQHSICTSDKMMDLDGYGLLLVSPADLPADPGHLSFRPLTMADQPASCAVEDTAFPNPFHRASREKVSGAYHSWQEGLPGRAQGLRANAVPRQSSFR